MTESRNATSDALGRLRALVEQWREEQFAFAVLYGQEHVGSVDREIYKAEYRQAKRHADDLEAALCALGEPDSPAASALASMVAMRELENVPLREGLERTLDGLQARAALGEPSAPPQEIGWVQFGEVVYVMQNGQGDILGATLDEAYATANTKYVTACKLQSLVAVSVGDATPPQEK